MRTTLNLDEDLLAVAKGLADSRGISLGDAVGELMRRGLRSVRINEGDDEFPTFDVAPGGKVITLDDVNRALDD